MSNYPHLIFAGSPLIPNFEKDVILATAQEKYLELQSPAMALSSATLPLMSVNRILLHVNLPRLAALSLRLSDLETIDYGYRYPLEAIRLAEDFRDIDPKLRSAVFEEIVTPTHQFQSLLTQEALKQNLTAIVNLQKIDSSGAQVFDFLRRYPYNQSDMFAVGMEISAIVYFNLAPTFAKLIGKDSWLTTPYDPTITGGHL